MMFGQIRVKNSVMDWDYEGVYIKPEQSLRSYLEAVPGTCSNSALE
jgi:hypothetical protein